MKPMAPSAAPSAVAAPPRITITSSSPELRQSMKAGLTNSLCTPSSQPASPPSAPATV
jgi:hypothetical protein